MKNKILIGLFIVAWLISILALPIINAQIPTLGTFERSTNVSLIQICGNETSPCDYCNITSVVYPNSTTIIENVVMAKDTTEFNYTLISNYTEPLGQYLVNGFCGDSSEIIVWNYNFYITPTGQAITTGQGFASIGLIMAMILLAAFFSFFGFKFSESEKLFPIALFFMLISLILGVYVIHLGYIYSRDILFPIATEDVQFSIYLGIMYGLIGMAMIGLLLLIIKTLKEFKERKSLINYGEGWNTSKNIYEDKAK